MTRGGAAAPQQKKNGNNGYANAHQCYIICTVLYLSLFHTLTCLLDCKLYNRLLVKPGDRIFQNANIS